MPSQSRYLSRTEVQHGLFLILVGRCQAPVWDVGEGRHITRKKPSQMSGYPPFPVQIILNEHEFMDRQARRAGIPFEILWPVSPATPENEIGGGSCLSIDDGLGRAAGFFNGA